MAELISTVFGALVIGAFLAAAFWFQKQQQAQLAAGRVPGMPQASSGSWERAFERSGYRHLGMEQAPMAQQVARSQAAMARAGDTESMLVREVGGHAIHWMSHTHPAGQRIAEGSFLPLRKVDVRAGQRAARVSTYWIASAWRLARSGGGPTLHLVERALAEGRAGSATLAERPFQPSVPTQATLGDADLDGRFLLYTDDEAAARALLLPLRAELLALAQVDLARTPGEVVFNDPAGDSIREALGGVAGMRALATDPGALLEKSLPVHDRIATLLTGLAG